MFAIPRQQSSRESRLQFRSQAIGVAFRAAGAALAAFRLRLRLRSRFLRREALPHWAFLNARLLADIGESADSAAREGLRRRPFEPPLGALGLHFGLHVDRPDRHGLGREAGRLD